MISPSTPPAVTAALKRLARDGLLRVHRGGEIRLTQKGRAEAQRLALRHQLAEKLLTDVIGLHWTRGTTQPSASNTASRPRSKRFC